jgi:hypothetical protein
MCFQKIRIKLRNQLKRLYKCLRKWNFEEMLLNKEEIQKQSFKLLKSEKSILSR